MPARYAEADGRTVVEDVQVEAVNANRVQEGLHDLGQVVEGAGECVARGTLRLAETRVVRRTVENMADGETYVLVFHPGCLDAFILGNSSLTVNRTKEVDALIDPSLRAWLEAQPDLRLVDYRNI